MVKIEEAVPTKETLGEKIKTYALLGIICSYAGVIALWERMTSYWNR